MEVTSKKHWPKLSTINPNNRRQKALLGQRKHGASCIEFKRTWEVTGKLLPGK